MELSDAEFEAESLRRQELHRACARLGVSPSKQRYVIVSGWRAGEVRLAVGAAAGVDGPAAPEAAAGNPAAEQEAEEAPADAGTDDGQLQRDLDELFAAAPRQYRPASPLPLPLPLQPLNRIKEGEAAGEASPRAKAAAGVAVAGAAAAVAAAAEEQCQSFIFGQDPKYTVLREYLGQVTGLQPFTVAWQLAVVKKVKSRGGPLYRAARTVAGSHASDEAVVRVVTDRHGGLSSYFLGVLPGQLPGEPGAGPGTAARPAFALSIQPPPDKQLTYERIEQCQLTIHPSCPAAEGSACFSKLREALPLTDGKGNRLSGAKLAPLLSSCFVDPKLVVWAYCRAVWKDGSPSWDQLRWWPLFPQAARS